MYDRGWGLGYCTLMDCSTSMTGNQDQWQDVCVRVRIGEGKKERERERESFCSC